MEDHVISLAEQLNLLIKKDKRIVNLNRLEKAMEEDDQVKILSYQLDAASTRYSDALKIYNHHDDKLKPYIKELSMAKEKLYELPIVKQYNAAYQEVKKLYDSINELLFKDCQHFKAK